MDVLLHRQEPDRRIRLPCEVIWQIQRNNTGGIFTEEDTMYYSAQALSKLKYSPQEYRNIVWCRQLLPGELAS